MRALITSLALAAALAANASAEIVGEARVIDGDTLAVGAKWHGYPVSSGAVYLFRRSTPGTWVQEEFLRAGNAGADDNFGAQVAIAGDTLVVGAFAEASAATGIDGDGSDDSMTDSGSVEVVYD